MKLFLASDRSDAKLGQLLAMAGGPGARMAIIPNAADALPALLDAGIAYSGWSAYGGWSAGSCVAGNTLRMVAPMDEPDTQGIGHPPAESSYEGLGLVPYGIIPHFRSGHPEANMAEDCVTLAERSGLPYRALRDGELIVVDGDQENMAVRGQIA